MVVLVVAMIVSTLAVMALVSYTKTMNLAYVNDAVRQLTLIHGANQVYKIKRGEYWPNNGVPATVSDINTNLQLSLNNPQFSFSCAGSDGISWSCSMQYLSSPNFTVQVTQAHISSTNPQCTANCP